MWFQNKNRDLNINKNIKKKIKILKFTKKEKSFFVKYHTFCCVLLITPIILAFFGIKFALIFSLLCIDFIINDFSYDYNFKVFAIVKKKIPNFKLIFFVRGYMLLSISIFMLNFIMFRLNIKLTIVFFTICFSLLCFKLYSMDKVKNSKMQVLQKTIIYVLLITLFGLCLRLSILYILYHCYIVLSISDIILLVLLMIICIVKYFPQKVSKIVIGLYYLLSKKSGADLKYIFILFLSSVLSLRVIICYFLF